jgi:predicted transposase YbfD/YdcC
MAAVPLLEILGAIPDPRDRRGTIHPLTAMLSLAVVAMLAGMRSLEAIAQFGRDHGATLAFALGFRRAKTPTKSAYSKLFRRLNVEQYEASLRRWLQSRSGQDEVVQVDGKRLCGSATEGVPGLHLVTAYAPQAQAVLGQLRVEATTNEHKAALELLGVLPLRGKTVTADAMFTHRDFCYKVREGGGEYLLPVKDNQPLLLQEITAVFRDADFSPLPTTARSCGTANRHHGQ